MIYDIPALKIKYSNYSNLQNKISFETKEGRLYRIKKGLYTDDIDNDYLVIANICNSPSYISFEYALSYYGLIPEYVGIITSACFRKKNNKLYSSRFKSYEYRNIPDDAFAYGILYFQTEKGIHYKIASKEKALCDTLYSKYPVRSIKDLKTLLFEDLRLDEEEFNKLDFNFILKIADSYHANSLRVLAKFVRGIQNK